ncbi:23S rRNA (adenine(2503)-C(2))-methyltransferase RlmN [Treponema sp. R80B11-R83G3]
MTSLSGLTLTEIEELLPSLPRFRASQIFKWIAKGANNFDEMSNLPASLRDELKERFCLYSSVIDNVIEDGETKKYVFSLRDESKIESVLLNDGKNRLTACLSTQVGCPAGCVFCKTGSLGFKRNLDCAEIIEQFLRLRLASLPKNSGHIIDNIVVMGMGEPLLNLPNLRKAILLLNDKKGINFSLRRITISTCGICAGLYDLAQNGPYVRLALSLTTADEPLRQRLMPIAKSNPLEKIKENLLLFQSNGGGRLTLEMPLLKQINTRDIDAKSAAAFAKGLDTVVNIIPWNPVAGFEFEGKPLCEPGKRETEDFIGLLESYGLKVTMRIHKGRSLLGACGQLG